MKYQIRREPNSFAHNLMMYRVYVQDPVSLRWEYVLSRETHGQARATIIKPEVISEVVEELEV